MARDQFDHDRPAPAPNAGDPAPGDPERRATREAPGAPTTVNLTIDVRGADPGTLSGVIGRIVAAVGSSPNMTIDIHAPEGLLTSAPFDELRADDEDPLAAFPAEHDPVEGGPQQRDAAAHAEQPPRREAQHATEASGAHPPAGRQSKDETGFEWYTQPAAGPLVRHGSRRASGRPSTATLPFRLRAAIVRAWVPTRRACSRVVDQANLLGVRARAAARQSLAHARAVRGPGVGRALGAGAFALTLATALVALVVTARVRPTPRPDGSPQAPLTEPARPLARPPTSTTGATLHQRRTGSTVAAAGNSVPAGSTGVNGQGRGEVARAQRESPRQPSTVRTKADARRFVGGLTVWSSPPGASVALNDRQVGTTPVRLRRLPVGTYAVRIYLDGFERWSRAVQVSSGSEAVIRPTLRPERAVSGATPRASR